MIAMPLSNEERVRIRVALKSRKRQDQREALMHVKELIQHDKDAALLRALQGHPNQPDDRGPGGMADIMRERRVEDAEGRSAGSAARQGVRSTYIRISCECVLDGLFKRANNLIGYEQWRAGMMFRRYWLAARQAARVSNQYGERLGGSRSSQEENAYLANATLQIDKAFQVLTLAQRRAVTAVCGEDERLGLRGKVLAAGLDQLVKLWFTDDEKKSS